MKLEECPTEMLESAVRRMEVQYNKRRDTMIRQVRNIIGDDIGEFITTKKGIPISGYHVPDFVLVGLNAATREMFQSELFRREMEAASGKTPE